MKNFRNLVRESRVEVSAPPMAARSLYTKMYAKHGGTASKAKEAQSKAYAEVEKKHGKQMRDSLEAYHKMNEETDTSEKNEMALTQLNFIQYASEQIHDFINDGGEVEEWYQNKLSKVHSDMESLHSYMEGEARRTGMKEEVSKTAEAPKMVRDRKTGEMYDPKKKFKELMDKPEVKAVMNRLAKEEVEQIDESLSDWKNEITRVHGDDVKFSKEKHKDGKTHHTTATSKSGKQVGNYVHSGSMQGGRVMNKSGAKVYRAVLLMSSVAVPSSRVSVVTPSDHWINFHGGTGETLLNAPQGSSLSFSTVSNRCRLPLDRGP